MTDGKTSVIGLRVTEEEKKILQQMADERGQNVSEVVRSVMFSEDAIVGELPGSLKDLLTQVSQAMKLPLGTVLVHILARRFAFDTAYFNKFGRNSQLWKEFFFEDTDDGIRRLVTGQELYDILVSDYERLFDEFKQVVKELLELADKSDVEASQYIEKYRDFVAAH
jgi:hypothetical protein